MQPRLPIPTQIPAPTYVEGQNVSYGSSAWVPAGGQYPIHPTGTPVQPMQPMQPGSNFDPVAAGWRNVGCTDWVTSGPVKQSEWMSAGTHSGPVHTTGWRPSPGGGPIHMSGWLPVGNGPAVTSGWMPAGTSGPIPPSTGFTPKTSHHTGNTTTGFIPNNVQNSSYNPNAQTTSYNPPVAQTTSYNPNPAQTTTSYNPNVNANAQ